VGTQREGILMEIGRGEHVEAKSFEKISIVIPTFNRKVELRECLKSIYRQDYPNFEVLVIDNGSTDGTKEMILEEYQEVRLFSNKRNLYISKARNFGIAKSMGEYIWFLDSDSAIANSQFMLRMLELMKADPSIGSIGGVVYQYRNGSRRMAIPKQCTLDMIENWDKKEFELVECDYLIGCNLFIKKTILLECGGFNEIFGIFSEDVDLGIRIGKYGLKNITDRRTTVLHPFRLPPVNLRRSYLFYRNSFLSVFVNYDCKEWPEILNRYKMGYLTAKRRLKGMLSVEDQRTLGSIVKGFGFASGFLGSLTFFIRPVYLKAKYGGINSVSKYMSPEGAFTSSE
jgi:GT2 family glycosyltransferase